MRTCSDAAQRQPTLAPRRPPPVTRPQTPTPALQAHHAPDRAPSRGVLRMASTCSRSPGPTPRDRMISVPSRGLCGTGWQQARKWGATSDALASRPSAELPKANHLGRQVNRGLAGEPGKASFHYRRLRDTEHEPRRTLRAIASAERIATGRQKAKQRAETGRCF